MKFTSLLKTVILENADRIDFLIDTYTKQKKKEDGTVKKPKMTVRELAALIAADPTSKLNDIDIETAKATELAKAKAGRYTPWIIKSYLNLNQNTEIPYGESGYDREVKMLKERFMEDLYKLTDDLKKFNRFKNKLPLEKRQIHNLTPDQLYDAVKDFDLTLATTTKAERKSAPVHPGAELMYDGNDWRVIKIEDKGKVGKEAACFYGGNNQETRWCTSAPGASWFDRYIKDGPLYVVFNPNDTDLSPMTGLPASIGRFQNLDMILLDNCIDSLPEEIGQCKNLRFLALPNNQGLKTLPKSIEKLPNLFFLNVKGCPSVEVPQAILSRAEDMCGGCGMWDITPLSN